MGLHGLLMHGGVTSSFRPSQLASMFDAICKPLIHALDPLHRPNFKTILQSHEKQARKTSFRESVGWLNSMLIGYWMGSWCEIHVFPSSFYRRTSPSQCCTYTGRDFQLLISTKSRFCPEIIFGPHPCMPQIQFCQNFPRPTTAEKWRKFKNWVEGWLSFAQWLKGEKD